MNKRDAKFYEAVGRYVCRYGADFEYVDIVAPYRGPDAGKCFEIDELLRRERERRAADAVAPRVSEGG